MVREQGYIMKALFSDYKKWLWAGHEGLKPKEFGKSTFVAFF